jgi:NDP-sugar pyrophosphorylase family protein
VGKGRWRALVLAAGHGTRLRPLTDGLPKPLLPVLGRSVLERTLGALAGSGCEAVAINLHHLAAAIPAALGEQFAGIPLRYSREDPILGTGGALVPLRDFFAGCDAVVVVNGDSLCEWPLADLLARHRRGDTEATLLLAGRPDPRPFGGGIGVDRHGRVTAIRADRGYGPVHRRYVFAGAHALRPELLARLPEGSSDSMSDLYLPRLAAGATLAAVLTWRPWHDLGTPRRYLRAVLDTARRETGGGWRARSALVATGVRLEGSVLEAEASVGRGARLHASLLLPGAIVEAGCDLRGVVVAAGVRIPANTQLADALVTHGARNAEPLLAAGGEDPAPNAEAEGRSALLVAPL